MMGALGDDHEGHLGDESHSSIKNEDLGDPDLDRDFAYLRYHLLQENATKDWKALYEDKNEFLSIEIKGKIDKESVSKISLVC